MPVDPERVQAVFLAAIEQHDLAHRATFVDRECGDDSALRNRVEALLRAHDQPDSLLDQPVVASTPLAEGAFYGPGDEGANHATADRIEPSRDQTSSPDSTNRSAPRPISEDTGSLIGPYKLREKIGEGGMGVVYLAEQEKPVRRRVALKIIKPGMDTGQVVARFEAERQALAIMDHPCIARVFDAGATDTGRPYFVMELVKGVPITDYCDTVHLNPQERLRLFIPVCRAIQHAHQKGIIHRDVKPSNVLVAMQDGKPVPKIIDFGIAKATEQKLTERSLFTQVGAIVGTLEYMSPEQADLSAMDIDTRTDVYALGVLLYELLTGSTPLQRARLRQSGNAEILKRIREEEPPKPSTRLSESKESLPSVAAQRKTEPARLKELLRGDLDWIVMKAIEKDRTRRYETANGFARDIERYLEGDPIEAGPPAAAYRLRKYARKHRAALVTATTFAALLVVATVVSAVFAVWATNAEGLAKRRLGDLERANAATTTALAETIEAKKATDAALKQSEEARAQAEAVSQYLVDAFRKPDPSQDGRALMVVDLLDHAAAKLGAEFAGSPKIKGDLLDALGQTYFGLGLPEKAVETFTTAWTVREDALGPDDPNTLNSRNNLAVSYRAAGRTSEAIALNEQTLKLRTSKLGPDHPDTLITRDNLAGAYFAAGRTSEAIAMHEETLGLMTSNLGPDHPSTLSNRASLAVAYHAAGRTSEAIAMEEVNLKLRIAKLGPDHPCTLRSRDNLAAFYQSTDRMTQAIAMHEEVLKLRESKLGPDHPDTLISRNNLAQAYAAAGGTNQVIVRHEENLKVRTAKLGPDHPDTLISRNNLAAAYAAAGRTSQAIAMHEENLKLMTAKLGPDHPDTIATRNNLAASYAAAGRTNQAIAIHEENLKLMTAKLGPDNRISLMSMNNLATMYLGARRWRDAEMTARECLASHPKDQPDGWLRFRTMSLLGTALAGQMRCAEAEPLIVQGFEGLKAHEATIPAPFLTCVTEAGARVVKLYEAWGQPEKTRQWRKKLGLKAPELPSDVFAR
jgi:eukaryotic-like serine/threonine-protein kinase